MQDNYNIARCLAFAMIASPFAVLVPGAAQAQGEGGAADSSQGGKIEEIIVTANKRAETSQKVPIAISSVSEASLVQSGISSTENLPAKVPGLTLQTGFAGLQPHIRGVGTAALSAGNENSVATYLDGVYISAMSAAMLQLSNVAQVDVLKGPQGTLFGRNATGGLIMIRTKDPSPQLEGNASITYGNYSTLSGSAYLTGPISDDVSVSFAAFGTHQGEGFGTNLFTGNEVGKQKAFAISSKVLAYLGDRTEVRLAADIAVDNNSKVLAMYPVEGYFSQIPGGEPHFPASDNPWNYDSYNDGSFKTNQKGISLNVKHDLDFAEMTSITAYRDFLKKVSINTLPVPYPLFHVYFEEPAKQFSQEFQLTSNTSSPVEWTMGLYYLHVNTGYGPFVISGDLFAPLDGLDFKSRLVTDAGAAYGQVKFPVFDGTNVTAGLRYNIEKRAITGYTGIRFPAPFEDMNFRDAVTDASKTFRKLTWRLGIDHQITDTAFAYLTYNRGFKSGVYDTLPAGGPNAMAVEPEVLDAFEVGLKTDLFDRRLRFNVGAFLYEYKNLQVSVSRATSALLENGAKARIYGIEAQFTAKPASGLTIEAGGELIHDRFRKFPNGTVTIPVSFEDGGGNIGSSGDLKGNRLPYAPDFTGNVSVNYTVPLQSGDISFSGNLYYSGSWYAYADNNLKQPAYAVLNAQVAWSLSDSGPKISVWGKNLTDKDYATFMVAQLNPGGGTFRSISEPRTYGVTLSQSF